MRTVEIVTFLFLSINFASTSNINKAYDDDYDQTNQLDKTTKELYEIGVILGIINPDKYSLEAFERDEKNVFKDLYKEYLTLYDPIDYKNWLIWNNFGLLPDTQESVFEVKPNVTTRSKQKFLDTVKTGDILITGQKRGGIVGHAAIMTSNSWVLEMPGISCCNAKSNNRRISKSAWYDIHKSSLTTVYRSPNNAVASDAASWATKTYFNANGGSTKTVHIDYKIDFKFSSVNPSYCSKLVIQAFHYGTGSKKVIDISKTSTLIAPFGIPNYFLSPYKLKNMGGF